MSEYIYEKIIENEPIRICEVTAAVHTDGDGAFFAQVKSPNIFPLFFDWEDFFSDIELRMQHVTQVNSIPS